MPLVKNARSQDQTCRGEVTLPTVRAAKAFWQDVRESVHIFAQSALGSGALDAVTLAANLDAVCSVSVFEFVCHLRVHMSFELPARRGQDH
jgi:hypothetical protein